jgi:hypothetical protein
MNISIIKNLNFYKKNIESQHQSLPLLSRIYSLELSVWECDCDYFLKYFLFKNASQ